VCVLLVCVWCVCACVCVHGDHDIATNGILEYTCVCTRKGGYKL
jgi:hypothetical protein